MRIKKIKSDGAYIYPATIAAAVKDANFLDDNSKAMTQGAINTKLYNKAVTKGDTYTTVSYKIGDIDEQDQKNIATTVSTTGITLTNTESSDRLQISNTITVENGGINLSSTRLVGDREPTLNSITINNSGISLTGTTYYNGNEILAKSETEGFVKNDGTIDTNTYIISEDATLSVTDLDTTFITKLNSVDSKTLELDSKCNYFEGIKATQLDGDSHDTIEGGKRYTITLTADSPTLTINTINDSAYESILYLNVASDAEEAELDLPSTYKSVGDAPSIEAGKSYVISILNGIIVSGEITTTTETTTE